MLASGWLDAGAFHLCQTQYARRLPDTPERMHADMGPVVFTTIHGPVLRDAILSVRHVGVADEGGQSAAALDGDVFWNPSGPYVPIGLSSLSMGHWILWSQMQTGEHRSSAQVF